jgi:hypothetical protein
MFSDAGKADSSLGFFESGDVYESARRELGRAIAARSLGEAKK